MSYYENNFRDWIVEEAKLMGFDFNSIQKDSQNQFISSILAGIENGFRSRMDAPDMRFGKRRGIYKNSSFLDNKNESILPNSDDLTTITDSCGDTSRQSCSDPSGCVYMENCGDGQASCNNTGCIEFDGSICDNSCIHEDTSGCTDVGNCTDRGCENSGVGTDKCVDQGSGTNNSCIDEGCQNEAVGGCFDTLDCSDIQRCINNGQSGCFDSQNCVDEEKCFNNSQEANCIDSSGCKDRGCDNRNQFGNECIDGSCFDDACCNRNCLDNSQCGDGLCANGRECKDVSCTNGADECGDIGCLNTGIQVGCSDETGCKDAPCYNDGKECLDTGSTCNDSPCTNWSEDRGCTNTANSCTSQNSDEGRCINRPYCPPSGGQDGCMQDWGNSSDDASPCHDQGGGCPPNITNNAKACWDGGEGSCIDGYGCMNSTNCLDSGLTDKACKDDSCRNESYGACIDVDNCKDSSCKNNSFCMNQNTCNDQSCTFTKYCVDVGASCKMGVDEATACTQPVSDFSSSCPRRMHVRDRYANYVNGDSCPNDPTDIPPNCAASDTPASGCPVCDTRQDCKYADHSLQTCYDHNCDPPPLK